VTLVTFAPPEEPLEGVQVVVLTPFFSRSAGRLRYLDFWGPARGLRHRLDALGVDVLMASYATNYGWLGTRCGFHPMILQTWTGDVDLYPWVGWKRYVLRPVVRRALQAADVITTDGPALAQITRTRFPGVADKVVSTMWGIRLADYAPAPGLRAETRGRWEIPGAAPLVVSVRGVKDCYRPDIALPALLDLLDVLPDVQVAVLTLAHERPPRVQADLNRLAAHPRARVFDRFLDKKEMRALYAAADVLVSVPDQDGISEAVLEGLYAGVVPVLSDIPSNRALAGEGVQGVFVAGTGPAALCNTLQEALDHLPMLRETMAPHNRRWVAEQASVEQTARQVAEIVRRLAG